MRVLFLIGCDLYSYNFANELCHAFAKNNFSASFLVFKNELAINQDKLPIEIKNLIRYERTIFSDVILTYLNNHPSQGKYLNLETLAQQYNINYAHCPNLENKIALQFILSQAKEWNNDITISIRCIEKFDHTLIQYFTRENENYFWNIHPGLLPQYRGIMPVFGAMMNQEKSFGYTLHRVSEKLDDGTIIDMSAQDIDYAKSMFANTLSLIPSGVDLIIKNLLKFSQKEKLPCLIQDEKQKGFYSFPTTEEIELFLAKKMTLYSKEEILTEMQDLYLTAEQKKILANQVQKLC